MASNTPKPAKQLGELLQEQQEPFALEIYLLERGYLKKSLNSGDGLVCCSHNSSKYLKRSGSCGTNKSRKGILQCSKILRAVFNKLVSDDENPSERHSGNTDGKFSATERGRSRQEVDELERFSSASSTTVFNSCSESDTEDTYPSSKKDHISSNANSLQALLLCNPLEKEIESVNGDARRTVSNSAVCQFQKKYVPVKVPQLIKTDELEDARTTKKVNQSTSEAILPKKVNEDSIFLASFRELFLCAPIKKPGSAGVAELQEFAWFDHSPRNKKSQGHLQQCQQTRQLLFDCVREVVENHKRKERRHQRFREFLGPEELGKLLCAKISAWGKQSGEETDIIQQLHLDFLASAQEWNDFRPQTRELGKHIGDAILEEIRTELVTDMIDFFATKWMLSQ